MDEEIQEYFVCIHPICKAGGRPQHIGKFIVAYGMRSIWCRECHEIPTGNPYAWTREEALEACRERERRETGVVRTGAA